MSLKWKSFALISLYTLLVSLGCWGLCRSFSNPFPSQYEAPHLLTTATLIENLPHTAFPTEVLTEIRTFHHLAARFVQFFGVSHDQEYGIRTYRLFSITLAVTFLLLIPALGLRRRGGLFKTADAPFWMTAFIFLSPAFLQFGSSFLPFTLHALLFLIILVVARAYVQWPGYFSAITFGITVGITFIAESSTLWAILLFLPAICISVGWRRLLLYWHTGHVFSALASLLLLILSAISLQFNSPIQFPQLISLDECTLDRLLRYLLWFGLGGFGLLAWGVVTSWGIKKHECRWEKMILFLFPIYFVAAFCFQKSILFSVPLILLSAILAAFLLTAIPKIWIRITLGGLTLLVLGFGMMQLSEQFQPDPSSEKTQVEMARELRTILKTASPSRRTAILTNNNDAYAILAWKLRHYSLLPKSQFTFAEQIFIDTQHPAATFFPQPLSPLIEVPPQTAFYLHRCPSCNPPITP